MGNDGGACRVGSSTESGCDAFVVSFALGVGRADLVDGAIAGNCCDDIVVISFPGGGFPRLSRNSRAGLFCEDAAKKVVGIGACDFGPTNRVTEEICCEDTVVGRALSDDCVSLDDSVTAGTRCEDPSALPDSDNG